MLISYQLGQTSIIIRVKLRQDTTGAKPGNGSTGLTGSSTGLIISTIADNESAATAYTASGATIQTIATLGTYAAPSASNCRFGQVDSTNHPGIYELQFANARFNVASSKSLLVSISGVSGVSDCDVCIPLQSVNPYDGTRGGMTALPNANAGAAGGLWILGANAAATTTLTGVAAAGASPATAALSLTGGAASTTGGGTAAVGFQVTGGAGAASTNGAAGGVSYTGGGTNTVASAAHGLQVTGTSTGSGLSAGSGSGATGDGITATSNATNGNGVNYTGNGTGVGFLAAKFSATTSTSLAALSCTTLTASGAVAFQSTFIITGATTFTGNVGMSAGLNITQTTTNTAALVVTGNGSGNGATFTGGAAVTTTAGGHGVVFVGGAASTSAGGTAGNGMQATGGAGAASTNGAATGVIFAGGGTNTVASTADGLTVTGKSNGNGMTLTHAGTGVDLNASTSAPLIVGVDWSHITNPTSTVDLSNTTIKNLDNNPPGTLTAAAIATGVWQDATAGDFTVASSIGKSLYTSGNVPGAASGLLIAGSNAATTFSGLTTGALSCTTVTASGAVAFQSTFTVTGVTAFNAGVTMTGVAAVTSTPATAGLTITGGAASTTGGGTSAAGIIVSGGNGAASTNGAAAGATFAGGGVTTVSGGDGITATGTGNGNGLHGLGAGSGGGAFFIGGATGIGLHGKGGATSGDGAVFEGFGAGNGMTLTHTGSNVDLNASTSAPLIVGVDWSHITNQGSTVNLSATTVNLVNTLTTYTGNTPQTGDAFARLGAPAGASVSADIAEIEAETDGIAAIPTNPFTGSLAQIANAVWTDTVAGDFTVAASIGKSVMNGVALGTGLTINAYTGDTPQTGDSYARIGATGSGLTSLAPASTALSNAQWTNTRAGYLDNLGLALTESYAADGATATMAQLLYMIYNTIQEVTISGTTMTFKKLDGSTSWGTATLDSSTAPTTRTRST